MYMYICIIECSRRYPSTMTVLMDITFRWHCRKLHLFCIPWPGQVLLAGQEQLAGRRHPAGAPGRGTRQERGNWQGKGIWQSRGTWQGRDTWECTGNWQGSINGQVRGNRHVGETGTATGEIRRRPWEPWGDQAAPLEALEGRLEAWNGA